MKEIYAKTRDRLELYFDQTALKAWELLTTDMPISVIRARVRAGRDRMRQILIDSLPPNLDGCRVLDAGCGTGQTSVELAKRGAHVVGVDISANLINLARDRMPVELVQNVDFFVGDMLSNQYGAFDHVIAMDSLIHYSGADISTALSSLAENTKKSISFTVAPKTFLLTCLLTAGKMLPRSNRSPSIAPISKNTLNLHLNATPRLKQKKLELIERVKASFYVSEAMILKL